MSVVCDQSDDILLFFRHTKLASLYKINGFPTIKFIKEGRPIDYNGPRTEASIMSFVDRAQR